MNLHVTKETRIELPVTVTGQLMPEERENGLSERIADLTIWLELLAILPEHQNVFTERALKWVSRKNLSATPDNIIRALVALNIIPNKIDVTDYVIDLDGLESELMEDAPVKGEEAL